MFSKFQGKLLLESSQSDFDIMRMFSRRKLNLFSQKILKTIWIRPCQISPIENPQICKISLAKQNTNLYKTYFLILKSLRTYNRCIASQSNIGINGQLHRQ